MLVCSCGFNPWSALETDNSGPDEDSARVALMVHLSRHNGNWAGGDEWLVRRDHDDLYLSAMEGRNL